MNGDELKSNPGEILGWPKLKLTYRTDPDRIAELLPPGFEPGPNPHVHIGIYCVPVKGEPEYGVSTKVEASFDGMPGLYSMGMGIDQESAIFISQELNGQPKFPCNISYFRFGQHAEARCEHQGYTFLEFAGTIGDPVETSDEVVEENEWWIKSIRGIGGVEKQYDLPPTVVRVHSTRTDLFEEPVEGELRLLESPWDPYTRYLPMIEPLGASLVTAKHHSRDISKAGMLDPDAFWPYADVIGGSRWPGESGGPRPR